MSIFSHRIFRFALAALVSSVPVGAATQQQSQPRPAKATDDARVTDSLRRSRSRQIPPERQRFWFESGVTNVYDSNVEHDSTNIGSYGIVAGSSLRFRTRSSRPAFHLEYGVAFHSYTATDKWDRVSQLGRAGMGMPLGKFLLLGLTAEAALKGSSEDREIGDQYAILPRLEIRPTDNFRLRVITAYRRRYYGESSGSNAINRYATVDSRIRVGGGTLEGAARFEENLPETERNRFERQTYRTSYTWVPGRRDELSVGLEYRPVRYPGRAVDIEDEDGEDTEVPRRDRRWKPESSWTREWMRNLRTELEYEYEMRFSNDPNKKYRGHVLTFTTAIPW